jgi:hypothetical protein
MISSSLFCTVEKKEEHTFVRFITSVHDTWDAGWSFGSTASDNGNGKQAGRFISQTQNDKWRELRAEREREAYHKLTQTVHYADRLVGAQVVASALSLVIKERELP